ncbi:YceI family protein [Mycobacterium sp.]|jgi:polyisoprenoid-binding protein YceI|uniref:YceI family protein n=1 Tax=Mycobacterium sp. TaxID=1785 RepID=UPI002D508BAE|nr:YceI family protein [Mycobacterium sp.]HZA12381.1 YceI family protein [Mycobacterium sp.]
MPAVTELLGQHGNVGMWKLVPDRSEFTFQNTALYGLAKVNGRFTEFSGEGEITVTGSVSGRINIKAASLNTGLGMRDRHLRSGDFFDAHNYPDITVVVTGVYPGQHDAVNVRADLTVRGKTVPLPMQATVTALADGSIRITTTTVVERERFGVSGNMAGMAGKSTIVSADALFRKAEPPDA